MARGFDRMIFESLNVCVCVLGHMETNLSGTSCEILGFLMIQNILCFTSGIVNALCIIDMGLLVVKRQCDTLSQDENMREARNSK